jgi:GAF domain-containing protein
MLPGHDRSKLRELVAFDPCGTFDESLYRLTALIGEMLAARRVSLMLRDVSRREGTRLKLAALAGQLPEAAWKDEPGIGEGIAGRVMASGRPVRSDDIARSEWRELARRPEASASFMACPVPIGGQPAGVLNISEPIDRPAFSDDELYLAELAALLVGRSIQELQLRGLLDSRFAQMALASAGQADARAVVNLAAHEPDQVARMLAKSFYKEMRHCGFSPGQIVNAAGEIISELTGSLNRHKKRMERV